MSSFVYETIDKQITQLVYRPKQSTLQAPRKWWQYAIQATLLSLRASKKLDLWRLVSQKNSAVYDALLLQLPPLAVRNRLELEALRLEVQLLRKENDTLRKMVSDALEPSVRGGGGSPSKDNGDNTSNNHGSGNGNDNGNNYRLGGSVTEKVRAFTENDDYEEFNRLISRTTTNNSTIPTVDLENDDLDEDNTTATTAGDLIQHDKSSLSVKLRSLYDGSSESTALSPSPYNVRNNESPYQRSQRISAMKRNMQENNRLINKSPRDKRHSPGTQPTAQESTSANGAVQPPTNINATRQRSTLVHVQRILRAAEIIMEKEQQELPFTAKFENSALDTTVKNDPNDSSPVKLPLDNRLLTREERSSRAQSVYSPRTSDSPARLGSISENNRGNKISGEHQASPRKSRQSRSPSRGTKKSPSRSVSKTRDNNISSPEPRYPMVTPDLSPNQKVAIEIIKEVRFQGRKLDSPVANRPLSRAEMTLLESPFAKPLLSPRDRDSVSPRTNKHKSLGKKGKVHDESAALNTSKVTNKDRTKIT